MGGGGGGGGSARPAQTGIEGSWIDAQGTGLSTLSGGIFSTVATDTGQKLAEGSYVANGATSVQISGTSLIRQFADQLQLPAGLDQPAELHEPRASNSC